jgi:hypothetical protein
MSSKGKDIVAGILQKPVRNRFFFGKKLDVLQFEREQNYFNAKRWLLNRLVSGFGVVCGLNVIWADRSKRDAILVRPGLAIDKWGREIIVSHDSMPVKVAPPAKGETRPGDELFVYICLEYLECEADPAPVLSSECNGGQRCMPDTIQERYKIKVVPGRAPELGRRCQIPDLADDDTGEIDYEIMAKWISEKCPPLAEDPCIPLAEIEFDEHGHCEAIDITVRPIVYTNDLLFEMIKAITENRPGPSPWAKQ